MSGWTPGSSPWPSGSVNSKRSSRAARTELEKGVRSAFVTERLGQLGIPTVYAALPGGDELVAVSSPLGAHDVAGVADPAVAKLQVFIFVVMVLMVGVGQATRQKRHLLLRLLMSKSAPSFTADS